MRQDIWKYVGLISLAGLLGWYFDFALLAMLICSVSIIGWQVYRLDRLFNWLSNHKNNPYPATHGQFYLLHRSINQRFKKDRARKRQLTKHLKQFRQAASALPNAIVLIDKFGKIQWANVNAEKLFGIQWPSDLGVGFTDLIRDPKVEDLLASQLEQKETEINSKLDPDLTLSVQVVSYMDDLRMVIGRDISRLVKINQIQSDFVANVSHELKTPLTVLKGYLEILQNSPKLSSDLEKPLQQMSTQSVRMEFIVQDLLYLAKLENRDEQPDHKPVDITHIINTIIETITDRQKEKQLKIELDIDYRLQLLGSHTELHAAFSNLIFNAVNYTPKRGVINVSWRATDDGACFSVRDNGDGIPEQHIANLTRRFYRVDNDRSRERGGTGLGLAIVKHVLQRHNGDLEIDSQIGVGSEFQCVFPAKQMLQPDSLKATT
ncbi:MAG: phosphate regulon sensor histidine kinase PhoR [Acidiferrobacterales bacterium]|nr:phosphate regulon sensor histidine kinase PhoR [Acidiferrobacterales bacterium]